MKTLCWFDVYFIRFKIQINWVISSKNFCLLRKSKLYSFYDIWIQLLSFLLFLPAFFLAASANSSCHNFSSKYFCSFELSCGCFVLSNAMWVVLGARSCHWVVFEKSAVLQLNELFWVIIIFLADAQDMSTIVSSALWNNTKGAIHNWRFTATNSNQTVSSQWAGTWQGGVLTKIW